MKEGDIRARISFPSLEESAIEQLLQDVQQLGLKLILKTRTTALVATTEEHWGHLGIKLQQRKSGSEIFYSPVNGYQLPESLQKYENIQILFQHPLISPGSL